MSKIFKAMILGLCFSLQIVACAGTPFRAVEEIPIIELNGGNTVFIDRDLSPPDMDMMVAAIIGKRVMLQSEFTLFVVISSSGGEVSQMKIMESFLPQLHNVILICKECDSAAGHVFATSSLPRLVKQSSKMMMHEMYQPHFTAKDSRNKTSMLQFVAESDAFDQDLYEKMGMTREAYEQAIIGKEWVVSGPEMVKLHLADKVVKIHCDDYVANYAVQTCGP